MFWRFGFHTPSQVDAILEKDNFTIEELFGEDEVLQELKAHNKKLIEFFSRKDQLDKLIDIIVKPAAADAPEERKTKFPFLASEVLAADAWSISENLAGSSALLDKLFGYLDTNDKLDNRSAAYFAKVVNTLLQKPRMNDILAYMKTRSSFVPRVVHHVGTTAIMELLLKLISMEDMLETDAPPYVQWLSSTSLVVDLVNRLSPSLPAEVHENAGQSLVDLISVTSNRSLDHPLMTQLNSKEVASLLIKHCLSGSSSAQTHCVNVIIELLSRKVNLEYDEKRLEPTGMPEICIGIHGKLKEFFDLLVKPPSYSVTTTTGLIKPPLGQQRLKVLEFFVAVVRAQWPPLDHQLIKLNVVGHCFTLFFQYPWNNFLHNLVVLMVTTILDGASTGLFMSLLSDVRIIDRILDANKSYQKDVQAASTRSPPIIKETKGYMGHIVRLSNEVIRAAETNDTLDKVLKEHKGWNDFAETYLTEFNKTENTPLGGQSMGGTWLEDSDDEDLSGMFPEAFKKDGQPDLQAFTRYLVEQNFIDTKDPLAREFIDVVGTKGEGEGEGGEDKPAKPDADKPDGSDSAKPDKPAGPKPGEKPDSAKKPSGPTAASAKPASGSEKPSKPDAPKPT